MSGHMVKPPGGIYEVWQTDQIACELSFFFPRQWILSKARSCESRDLFISPRHNYFYLKLVSAILNTKDLPSLHSIQKCSKSSNLSVCLRPLHGWKALPTAPLGLSDPPTNSCWSRSTLLIELWPQERSENTRLLLNVSTYWLLWTSFSFCSLYCVTWCNWGNYR